MKEKSLLIIGAGAAGLMAAKQLSLYFNVTILEAENRLGGRIHSISKQYGIIEAGAEFIHGNLPITKQLLQDAHIQFIKTTGENYRKKEGVFNIDKERAEGWEEMLQKMKSVTTDVTLEVFLQSHYADQKYAALKKQVIAYAEGFDLADYKLASVRSLYKEWSAEDEESYRIPSGYKALVDYMAQQAIAGACKILLNKTVERINWNQDNVAAYTTNKEVFRANKILIATPLNLLFQNGQKSFLQFDPPINAYAKAAQKIGLGAVIKVVLKFNKTFWKPDAQFFFSDEKFFPTWWTQLPNTAPILTGWMGGPTAAILAKEDNDSLLQKSLLSLASIFDISKDKLIAALQYGEIFNWQANTISPGGYSYDMVNSADAKTTLSTPLFNTIFFAGEALYQGSHPGTVEAALASGQHIATQIKG